MFIAFKYSSKLFERTLLILSRLLRHASIWLELHARSPDYGDVWERRYLWERKYRGD